MSGGAAGTALAVPATGDPAAASQAIGDAVLERLHTLITYRRWYRSHPGWLVTTYASDTAELRYLLRLRREGRRLFEAAPDPVTAYQSEQDRVVAAAQADPAYRESIYLDSIAAGEQRPSRRRP